MQLVKQYFLCVRGAQHAARAPDTPSPTQDVLAAGTCNAGLLWLHLCLMIVTSLPTDGEFVYWFYMLQWCRALTLVDMAPLPSYGNGVCPLKAPGAKDADGRGRAPLSQDLNNP